MAYTTPNRYVLDQLTGKAGEYAVASQLMVRGMSVLFPAVDHGVDLQTENGCRIQVKSAHMTTAEKAIRQHGEGVYVFPRPSSRRILCVKTGARVIDSRSRKASEYCDIVVFWGIEQNRFWVAPSNICDDWGVFALGKRNPSNRYVGSEQELREMVSLGYNHAEIARQLGVCRPRVTMMLNHPETIATTPSAVSLVRNCENAWENILEFSPTESQDGLETVEAVVEEKEI
jgi:hypothetical protein